MTINMTLVQVAFAMLLGAPRAVAGDAAGLERKKIELWTRASGSFADGNSPTGIKRKELDLSAQHLSVVRQHDVQYGIQRFYRGLHLAAVVESYPRTAASDLLLLHFDNGMIIPLPLDDDLRAIRRLDPFVAMETKLRKTDKWSRSFEALVQYDERNRSSRPLAFNGNKVVVATLELPAGISVSTEFSPWLYVTTLTGLEFVNRNAYERQFRPAGVTSDDSGFAAFSGRCQFCHGVRGIGASFGWDFVTPVPIYELKQPQHLFNKVKYPYHDAIQRGLLMPTQPDVREAEMSALWDWLRKVGTAKLPPYRP